MREKMSAQTQMVLNILSSERCHLTADEVLSHLEGTGKATVYRALDALTGAGKIRRLSLGKKSAVYEYVRSEHMHFVCNACGCVYDIAADLSGMVREAAKCCGHEVEWGEVTAYGICKACCAARKQRPEASLALQLNNQNHS